jgi:transposase
MGNSRGVRRDFAALEARRFQAACLVSQGISQAEVARRLNVSRQTVGRWMWTKRILGEQALRKSNQIGRRRQLSTEQREMLASMLASPSEAFGYEGGAWTCARVAHLIESRFGVVYHPGHVWKLLESLGRAGKPSPQQTLAAYPARSE